MKKWILSLFIALTAQAASAQLSLAPELGIQMTDGKYNLGGQKYITKMKPGLRAGVNISFDASKLIQLQGGLYYSAMGFKFDEAGGGLYASKATMAFDYIELPLYLNFQTGNVKSKTRFFAGLGPYIAYVLNAKVKSDEQTDNLKIGNNNGDRIRRTDMGFNINAGLQLSRNFYIRARYSQSLKSNFSDPYGNSRSDLKHNSISLSLGYHFRF